MGVREPEPTVEPDPEETVATLVFHTARDVRTALERQLSNHGITAQQATLARLLRAWERRKRSDSSWMPRRPPRPERPSPFQIAPRLGTDGAGMTRLIDRLEAKGLVVRQNSDGDRRSISIELTATGLAIVKKAAPTFQGVNRQLLKGFTRKEVVDLTEMLRRLRENARGLSK